MSHPPPLRLLPLADVPSVGVLEFRPAFPWLSIGFLTLFCGLCAWGAWTLRNPLLWWVVFVFGGFGAMIAALNSRVRHAQSWLARATDAGLYLKWRSYQNHHLGDAGQQVVFVPWARITSAHAHVRHWATPESWHGGNRDVRYRFLELQLCNDFGTDALTAALAAERAFRPSGKGVYQHYPLSVEANATLRIEWNARPGLDALLRVLREHGIKVDAKRRSDVDLTHMVASATPEDENAQRQIELPPPPYPAPGRGCQLARYARYHSGRCFCFFTLTQSAQAVSDADLHELARRGELMTLIRVLRVHEKIGLTEAKQKAEALIHHAALTPMTLAAPTTPTVPAVTTGRREMAPGAFSNWRTRLSTAGAWLLLLLILAGWVGVFGSIAELHGWRSIAQWSERPGVIDQSYVRQARGNKGLYWKWELAGHFTDTGERFSVARIGYGVEHAVRRGTKASVTEISVRYPRGKRLPVFVDPERPNVVVLDRSNGAQNTLWFLGLCLTIGLLPAMLWGYGRWRARRPG